MQRCGRVRIERRSNCLEFERGVGQPLQVGEIGTVNVAQTWQGAPPRCHARAQHRYLERFCFAVGACCLLLCEVRVAKTDQRLAFLRACGSHAQSAERRRRGHHADGVCAGQPLHFAVISKQQVRRGRFLRESRDEKRQRHQTQRAIGDDDQALGRLPDGLHVGARGRHRASRSAPDEGSSRSS